MKALVVGQGSIGSRHARLLSQLDCKVSVVSRRQNLQFRTHATLTAAIVAEQPDYIVIANPTSEHRQTLQVVADAGFDGRVLVEKPLFDVQADIPGNRFRAAYVAYNLRFHPVIQAMRAHLQDEQAISAQFYAGQYLPTWRPDTDYTQSYSARRAAGGGVLRDLSHELDCLTWLFGQCRRVTAIGGHFSHLSIDSDDAFSVLAETERCSMATLQVNYLDRIRKREIIINTDRHTLHADLVSARLRVDTDIQEFSVTPDDTYLAQHRAVIAGDDHYLCTLKQGVSSVELVNTIEQAAASGRWISMLEKGSNP